MQFVAAQIEKAVGQARIFRKFRIGIDLQRQHFCGGFKCKGSHHHFNRAGRQIFIDGLLAYAPRLCRSP